MTTTLDYTSFEVHELLATASLMSMGIDTPAARRLKRIWDAYPEVDQVRRDMFDAERRMRAVRCRPNPTSLHSNR